ncbi:MAG: hypothetical protein NVS3B14_20360 [Ktedonobacteraceae bacterium]
MLEKRAREQYGLELKVGPSGINSRPALIATKYAEAQGFGNAFHKAVMCAYWQQAQSIDNPQVLKEIAAQVGLDTEHFDGALSNPTYNTEVTADVELAYEYGITAVPALVFVDKYLVVGAQPYEVLKQVVEKVLAEE